MRAPIDEPLGGQVHETQESKPPTVASFRAARALIGVSQAEMAQLSGVSLGAISRIERYVDDAPLPCRPDTWRRLVRALRAAGIEFVDNNTTIGVLRRKPASVRRARPRW